MEMYFICCCTWIMAIVFSKATGMATLTLPTSVNCGDQAVLTCTSTECNQGYRFIRDYVTIYRHVGSLTSAATVRYSATVTSASEVQLTITNITFSDAGAYQCTCSTDRFSAQQTLRYECKAVSSTTFVNTQKMIIIQIAGPYPRPSRIDTPLINHTSQLPGSYVYVSSTTLADHYLWIWYSNASLPDGNHGYNITVITETQVSFVSGYFKIVTPKSPTISNLSTITYNRQVVRGAQDTPLTIQCVSSGGIPAPTLAWYRGNTSTSPLAQSTTSASVQQPDGTYTVTLIHTFTPGRNDDMTPFQCRVFYPGATTGASPDPSPASVLLYLDLKPDKPTVSQIGYAVSGGNMTLECSSANSRPRPNITWSYFGQTLPSDMTFSSNWPSETFGVVSVLQRPVSAVDNGQTATCRVFHTILSVPLNSTINVDVKFGPTPGTVAISGNKTTPATGANLLRLNCSSGSSNPASNITWYNGSEVIPNTEEYTRWPGNNNGVISSNMLTIIPTRYMDGDTITCKTDNGYGSDSIYVSPPSTPTITDLSFVAGQVKLTVVPGYHWGLNQTIVVQTSTDHKTWHSSSSVNVGKVLSHTTLEISNYVRAYAFNSVGQSQNYSADLNVAVKQEEGTYCSRMSLTLAVSVSTTAFITIILCIVVNVIVFRRYPTLIMRILQHTCPGNEPKGNETKTVMQSQTSKESEKQIVFSTLVAAENPTGGENVEATPTYESLDQTRIKSVDTSLEAAENPTRGENVEATPTYESLDQTRIKSVDTSLEAAENPTRGENVEATPAYESLDQTRTKTVYTILEATENPTRGENVEATPAYESLD